MAVYVICPHCLHPTVMPRFRTGRGQLCRQCGQPYYVIEDAALAADAIPVRAGAHPTALNREVASGRPPAYEIV